MPNKDNSKISKQIINYILDDGDFKTLTAQQKQVIRNSLPELFFSMTRKENLKQNSTLIDSSGDSYKISYNRKNNWIAFNNSQQQVPKILSSFSFPYDNELTPLENLRSLITEVGYNEFFAKSLSKIANDKSWHIINRDITYISNLTYEMFDFDFFNLTSDFLTRNDVSTWFVKWENKNLFQIQLPISVKRPNSVNIRMNLDLIHDFLLKTKITNETWGISAEVALCRINNIPVPDNYTGRYDNQMVNEIISALQNKLIIDSIPIMTECLATKTKGLKKSPTDFKNNEKTISVKTNFNSGAKVCPPEFGQPGILEGIRQYNEHFSTEITEQEIKDKDFAKFKEMFQENIVSITNKQLEWLFSEDYILYLRKTKSGEITIQYIESSINNFQFGDHFTFSRDAKDWNDSVTIKYKGISLAEMQMHKGRSPFKFRFNLSNLMKIIKNKND